MSGEVFFDTNILLYSYSDKTEPKKDIAKRLIVDSNGLISTQVIQEMCNILIKKFKMDQLSIIRTLLEMNTNFLVSTNNVETVSTAVGIHFKYKFSYYDSLIIASAIENNCTILYSEDLQHKQKIENSLTIINPFK
jgi:predicted nucleic acid-binding protein